MNTFLRENERKLFLLGISALCLIILWSSSIYTIWWDLTPWKNLGSPPKDKIVTVGKIEFPYFHFPDSNPFHFVPDGNFQAPLPSAYIYAQNGIYLLDSTGNWTAVESAENPTLEPTIVHDEQECAVLLKTKWRLHEWNASDVRQTDERGYCFSKYHQYAAYRIDDRGEIWIKYLNSQYPEHFRIRVTIFICLLILAFQPIWGSNFLESAKPDYGAN